MIKWHKQTGLRVKCDNEHSNDVIAVADRAQPARVGSPVINVKRLSSGVYGNVGDAANWRSFSSAQSLLLLFCFTVIAVS